MCPSVLYKKYETWPFPYKMKCWKIKTKLQNISSVSSALDMSGIPNWTLLQPLTFYTSYCKENHNPCKQMMACMPFSPDTNNKDIVEIIFQFVPQIKLAFTCYWTIFQLLVHKMLNIVFLSIQKIGGLTSFQDKNKWKIIVDNWTKRQNSGQMYFFYKFYFFFFNFN